MMLLSPTKAALAIGAKCGGSAPSADDSALVTILNFITPRIEAVLDTYSLTLDEHQDNFRVPSMPRSRRTEDPEPEASLRLSNGFVVNGSVDVIDPDGATVDPLEYEIDYEIGLVNLSAWSRGVYKVRYQAGYEPEPEPVPLPVGYDPNDRVLEEVPDFIKAAAVMALVVWYRTAYLSPKVPKDVSYGSISAAMQREIAARFTGKYERPRATVIFGDRREYGS